jgi:hypothetical protein
MLKWRKNLLIGGLCLIIPVGCGNRQGNAIASPVAKIAPVPSPSPAALPALATLTPTTMPLTLAILPPAVSHYHDKGIAFDYPADWVPDKAQTACFAICAPSTDGSPSASPYSSLSLDVPRLPWHLPGMITVGMVARGYINDLKNNQIHDAVIDDQHPITVCGCTGRKIISKGHENAKPAIDLAIVLIFSDRVYILSADCDDAGYEKARKTLDAAVGSLHWIK